MLCLQRFTTTFFWFIDDNNSSGSDEDDYVVHSQRKLNKEGDKGRIKAAPAANMNTFNESLVPDNSMSRPQIVL
jgi:hypothetical protein